MSNLHWWYFFGLFEKFEEKKNQAASMIEVIWTRCEIDSIFLADWRVRPLVLYIKKWARFHDINDASKATISSYSLCLMLIHYLQCKSSWSPFIHEPCLFFLAMSVSLVTVYACLQVLSRSDYLILQISGAIFVVIIVFLSICRCLFPTGASLLTGALPCESIKSVVNVIHV